MSKKKLLITEMFNKAKEETGKKTKNALASYLWSYFDERFPKCISDRTLSRYYDAFIDEIRDEIEVEDFMLDRFSEYVGFKNFTDFSRAFVKKEHDANKTTVKISVDHDGESLTEKLSNIIINITNEQNFKMPEFMKQNGFGIVELTIVGLLLTGNFMYSNPTKKQEIQEKSPLFNFFGGAEPEKKCMYWDEVEYKLSDCENDKPNIDLKPVNINLLKYFKKITRKDTLTVENAAGKTWYSKYNGVVEFFTIDGEDPDNGRELRTSTPYIIEKYAGIQEE